MYTHVREFRPFLEANCPEADSALLELVVVLTCIDFCNETHFHQEDITIDLEADQAQYPIVLPPYNEMTSLKRVYTTRPLEPKSIETLDRNLPAWRNLQSGDPSYYHQTSPRVLQLVPAPRETVTQGVTITVALKPSPKAKHIWSRIYQEYHETIIAGALGRLCRMPKKPWTDRNSAMENEAIYRDGRRLAKVAAMKQFTNESIYREPRGFDD